MDPKTYQVERDGKFTTVKAQSPGGAATGLFPAIRPISWVNVSPTVTVINGSITVTEL